MNSQTFFDKAATLGGLFAFILVVSYLLSACAADAHNNREIQRMEGERCIRDGYSWQPGVFNYYPCRPTPTPMTR